MLDALAPADRQPEHPGQPDEGGSREVHGAAYHCRLSVGKRLGLVQHAAKVPDHGAPGGKISTSDRHEGDRGGKGPVRTAAEEQDLHEMTVVAC